MHTFVVGNSLEVLGPVLQAIRNKNYQRLRPAISKAKSNVIFLRLLQR
jgi:hypothetical protein